MKVAALVSGGKDSCTAMLECVRFGHEIVAIATLRPPASINEADSFMFQTVATEAVQAIAACMDLPFYAHTLQGSAVNQELLCSEFSETDEVADLLALLRHVKQSHPEIDAVCSGAIFSSYQRNRIELVCQHLGLVSLAMLWQRDQDELLNEMIEIGINAVLVKVASMGLTSRMLGQSIAALQSSFRRLHSEFGFNVCGEGGEYETFTLDMPLFTKRIVL
jgi:diphthine-ammonia ligase